MLQGGAREIAGELPLSANAVVVLKKRYLKKDEKGEPTEAAQEMFRRVAETIAARRTGTTTRKPTSTPPPESSTR